MTQQEEKAIKALKAVAKIWPNSLWLFSADGNLYVMKKNADGSRIKESHGGMSQEAIVDKIDIENDGGDW